MAKHLKNHNRCPYNHICYVTFLLPRTSINQRLLNAISEHPKLVTFRIGLAITFAIGTTIGIFDGHTAAANANSGSNTAGQVGRGS